MSNEMIDRVAAAIHSQSGIMIPFHSFREDNLLKAELRMRARLAIQALRNPTEEMIKAASCVSTQMINDCKGNQEIDKAVWQSMIDKILED